MTPAGHNQLYVPGLEYSAKLTVTANVDGTLLQGLFAVTLIFPEPEETKTTVIELVPCPADIELPEGTDQVYEIAPETGVI